MGVPRPVFPNAICRAHTKFSAGRRRGQAKPFMRRADGGDKLDEFLRWAAKSGVSDAPSSSSSRLSSSLCLGRSLVLADFPDAGGRGLAAARDLARGERVLTVPDSALLTSHSVMMADDGLATSVKRRPNLSAVQVLIVCLLAEVGKGRRSKWYLYLTQLPRSYDTLSNFSPFEIHALQIKDAVSTCESISARVHTEWTEAIPLMEEIGLKPRLTSLKAWLWASATVSSRALHVPWDQAGCLCPVGDFFNYDATEVVGEEFERNSHTRMTDGGYEGSESAYCFYARRDYKKGEQVLLCYGTYTNLELLEHYGFLLRSNPSEKLFVPIDSGMLHSSTWPRDALYIAGDGKPSFALLASLRLWGTPHHLRRKIGRLVYSGLEISPESEVTAMRWLEKRCQDVLDELPTDHDGDMKLMEMADRMLECSSKREFADLVKNGEGEIWEYHQASGLETDTMMFEKLQRCLGRFRLALRWRLSYKIALLRCIYYCRGRYEEVRCVFRSS